MQKRRTFILNGVLMSAVGIALRTVTLMFGAYISMKIGAEAVGLNTVIMSVYGFALTLASSGVNLTVTRLVASHIGAEREENIRGTLLGAIAYALFFSALATVLLFVLSGLVSTSIINDTRAMPALNMLALSLIPASIGGVFSGYFLAKRMAPLNAGIMLLGQGVRIAVTVILLSGEGVKGSDAVMALAIGLTVSEIFCFLLGFLALIIVNRRMQRGRVKAEIRPVTEMALPLAASAYIRSGLLSLEHSLIPKRLETRGDSINDALSDLGTMQGMALPMILYPLSPLSSFAGLLLPELAEAEAARDAKRRARIARTAITYTLYYAIITAAVLFIFSEELGYGIYNSYAAGYFIAILSPVIPIMYLDHVVDSMLKGIGEHVYSMWVNIADSLLSVMLVWALIPKMGIEGYALVIILMELFNFILSYIRLRKRIHMKISLTDAIILPSAAALMGAILARVLFVNGSRFLAWAFALKIIFVLCVYICLLILFGAIIGGSRRKHNR